MTAPEAGDGRVGWGKAPAFVIEAVTPIGFVLRTRQVPSLWYDLQDHQHGERSMGLNGIIMECNGASIRIVSFFWAKILMGV